jgi:hypothetical protein
MEDGILITDNIKSISSTYDEQICVVLESGAKFFCGEIEFQYEIDGNSCYKVMVDKKEIFQ